MIAQVIGDSLRCPHCQSTDPSHFEIERKVYWREPIRQIFRDGARLVLIAECDRPLIDMAGSTDELHCTNCRRHSLLDFTVHVHHEDPKT